ncbi:MAG: CCA tRNA nucleotidyltransferase [Proteobacteria bacterium]|nr:CCA tRNA nucleotidyltransferase [Pseudomonadota bacterium]
MFEEKWELLSESMRNTLLEFSSVFQKSGYQCFLVGGSCRDLLLGVKPQDFDFATNCPLSKTRELFDRVIDTGVAHGTLTILYRGHTFEVTRFRKDLKSFGRRALVEFSDSIVEDQERRDLRINAIAYDVVSGDVVDSQNGIKDFEGRMIHFVGDVTRRIKEDHLRALRYVRIISTLEKYGFRYDTSEMKQVKATFRSDYLSLERIYDEFNKMFRIENKNLKFLAHSLHDLKVFKNYLSLSDTGVDFFIKILRTNTLIPLFLEYQKTHGSKKTALNLKVSKKQRSIITLIEKYRSIDPQQITEVKRLMQEVEDRDLELLGTVFYEQLDIDLREPIAAISRQKLPFRLAHLALQGQDLLDLGIRGKKIGEMQKYLLKSVWENPEVNEKKHLQNLVETYFRVNE